MSTDQHGAVGQPWSRTETLGGPDVSDEQIGAAVRRIAMSSGHTARSLHYYLTALLRDAEYMTSIGDAKPKPTRTRVILYGSEDAIDGVAERVMELFFFVPCACAEPEEGIDHASRIASSKPSSGTV